MRSSRHTPATPAAPTTVPWAGHRRGSGPYRRVLFGLFFAGISTFAQLYSPQAALPEIADTLRIPPATAALVLSASTVGLALGVIPWSIVADHAGRVRAMAIAVAGATLVGLLVPFAPTLPLLLAGRFVEGALVGGVPVIALAYLNEEIHRGDAARAAGVYVAGTTIGGLLGRLVSGPVAEAAGWRLGMFAVAVICVASSAAFVWLTPAPRGFTRASRRSRRPGPTGRSARTAGDRAAARRPGLAGRLWASIRSPRLLTLYAVGFLLMGGFVALYNYLGFRLVEAPFDLPTTVVSLVFMAYLAGTWSASRAGGLAARRGRLPVLLGSIAVMIAGVLLTLGESTPVVLAGLVIATAGFFAAHAVASGWTGSEATVGRAQAASLYNLFYYAGSSVFGWYGGVLFAEAGWGAAAALIAGLAAAAGLLALLILRAPRVRAIRPGHGDRRAAAPGPSALLSADPREHRGGVGAHGAPRRRRS